MKSLILMMLFLVACNATVSELPPPVKGIDVTCINNGPETFSHSATTYEDGEVVVACLAGDLVGSATHDIEENATDAYLGTCRVGKWTFQYHRYTHTSVAVAADDYRSIPCDP